VSRIIENWHDAEDIAQDVFIRFMTIDTEMHVREEVNYLFRMARNKGIDYIRRKESSKKYLDSIEGDYIVEDTVTKYDEYFQLVKIHEEISRMKESKYKTILTYHVIRGLSFEEISKEFNIAKDVLRKNKCFGINKLKEKFAR
jgi:RNA polymerase sigma-70 factor (ECF subfamily)